MAIPLSTAARVPLTAEPALDRPRVSACIIAYNEEDRIGDCIDSVAWCDEVLVVDSHSTDGTREVARQRGARILERDWPGHVAQKEFAIRAASHDWVLCVDADERVSDALREEIVALRDAGFADCDGWEIPRSSNYLGRWIRHGNWYPDWSLRLFDRRRGRWGGMDPHDHVELDSSPERLKNDLLHVPYRKFDEHLETIARYTTIMAGELNSIGRRARLVDLTLRPPARFLVFYLVRRGFLDGWRGFVLAVLASYYVFLKYAKLYALQRDARMVQSARSAGAASDE